MRAVPLDGERAWCQGFAVACMFVGMAQCQNALRWAACVDLHAWLRAKLAAILPRRRPLTAGAAACCFPARAASCSFEPAPLRAYRCWPAPQPERLQCRRQRWVSKGFLEGSAAQASVGGAAGDSCPDRTHLTAFLRVVRHARAGWPAATHGKEEPRRAEAVTAGVPRPDGQVSRANRGGGFRVWPKS